MDDFQARETNLVLWCAESVQSHGFVVACACCGRGVCCALSVDLQPDRHPGAQLLRWFGLVRVRAGFVTTQALPTALLSSWTPGTVLSAAILWSVISSLLGSPHAPRPKASRFSPSSPTPRRLPRRDVLHYLILSTVIPTRTSVSTDTRRRSWCPSAAHTTSSSSSPISTSSRSRLRHDVTPSSP